VWTARSCPACSASRCGVYTDLRRAPHAQLYVSGEPAPLAFGAAAAPVHIEVLAFIDGDTNMPVTLRVMNAAEGQVNQQMAKCVFQHAVLVAYNVSLRAVGESD